MRGEVPVRILHVLDHSLPLHSGYTFRTRAILKAQIARGWEVAALTGVRHSAGGPPMEVIDDLTFFRTPPVAPLPSPLGEWREVRALAKRIATIADLWKPDQLHVHSPVLNALAALRAARELGLPIVYEIRAFWEDAAVGNGTGRQGSLRYRATHRLETYAAKSVDAVAVICDGLRDDLIGRGIAPDRIVVAPNGVDLDLFGDPPPRDAALTHVLGLDGAEVIGFIGSFYDYEGLDDLIAAMPALVGRLPRAHLLLVGGGPCEPALRAQAAASPVADRIHFAGRVPHDQVDRYYSVIDVLAYPRKPMRLTELVTPLKPLEAMAQRRLVAASDVGGHRELIEPGVTGTLFAAGDPAAIAESLATLFERRGDWASIRERARRFVEQERDWALNVDRYAPVYQRLTGKAG